MEWFAYLLKVSACTALFFGFYLLFLRKLTFFRFNRVYLLASLLLSCIIPAIHIPIKKELPLAPAATVPYLPQSNPVALKKLVHPVARVVPERSFNWQAAAQYIYVTIALALLLLPLWQLTRILKHIKHPRRRTHGLWLISKKAGFTNCSFFNYVFVDESSLSNTELELFLNHEEVHVKQLHSVDKVLMILAKAVMWINPVIYLYHKALTQVHEFEADAITSRRFGKEPYAQLILSRATAAPKISLAHQFTESPIKERIKMLFTPKSNKMKQLSYAFILPIGMGLIGLFGIQFVMAQQTPPPAKEIKKVTAVTITEEKIPPGQREKESTGTKNRPKTYRIITDSAIADHVEHVTLEHVNLGNAVVEGTVNLYNNRDSADKTQWHLAEARNALAKTGTTMRSPKVVNEGTVRLDAITTVLRLDENTGCRISGIENDAKYTVVSFEYTAARASDWALLNKEIYLQANNDMKHFAYVKSEGIPLAPHRYNFTKPGEKIAFKVYFEKVPLTAKSIDVIERAGRSDFFNFYSVPLPASYYAQK
ncbi:M56 family metallopeptidase [Niabella hirudinis]|uniref:M56 family metallopeptidase n=1 Tax=Niabella hirudinis TaxID=1285929 RepID=UPI003EB8A5AB